MKNLKIFGCLALALMLVNPVKAQMLEDESYTDDSSEYDALFNEMYNEKEKVNKTEEKKADTQLPLEEIAKSVSIKVSEDKQKETDLKEKQPEIPPIDGVMEIGISKGSFKIFQDVIGRTTCTFGVTLKSNLNKDIRNVSLRLAYPQRAFAFIFKNIKPGEATEKYIKTWGEVCYNLSGVPNIDINRCRIFASREDECAKRIKWDAEIISPDPSKNPYL